MLSYVEFISENFPPYDGEEDEINPGRFGKRLAEFLANGLEEHGYSTSALIPEDWGWVVRIENEDFDLWIGCGNYEEYEDGFLCFIEPHQERIRKFLFFGSIDTTGKVSALQRSLNEILTSEPTVSGIKWATYEEFNNPVSE